MTAKKREFPGLTCFPEVTLLRRFSAGDLTPIWSATEASCTSVSSAFRSDPTEASTWSPTLFGICSSSAEDGDVLTSVVEDDEEEEPSSEGVWVPDVEGGVDPMSCSKLYSIPLTIANSWSSTTDMSRLCSITAKGDPGRSMPSSASNEYVIPLTCSTRDSWTVPKCKTVPSAGLTCFKSKSDKKQ